MFSAHTCDLNNPDIDEIAFARTNFEDAYEEYTPEERETAYWDYDSEAQRRYSDADSNEDSSNEDNDTTKKRDLKYAAGYNSSESSSSSSSNNSQNRSSRKKKTKKRNNSKKIQKEASIDDDKMKKMEEDLKKLNSRFEALNSAEKVYEHKISQIEKLVKDLNTTDNSITKENNEIQSSIVELIKMKNDSTNENEVNRNKIQKAYETMSNWIKSESTAREEFNDGLLEKCNKLELSLSKLREESTKNSSAIIEPVREECKKTHLESDIPKTEKCSQKIVLAENQEQSVIQNTIINDNPAVPSQDTLSLNIKNYDPPSPR